MVSCNDLLSLNIFENIELVAGKKGIYKSVSWPYICQTLDFSQWINGGELMFLTGMNMDLDDNEIINLIYECVKKDISGIVILTNSEYINTISENVIKTCDMVGLPLFNMPWDIKLIDVTKEIANYIMKLNYKQNKDRELIVELLFSKKFDEDNIKYLISRTSLKLENDIFIAAFIINKKDKVKDQKLIHNKSEYKDMMQILNIIKSNLSRSNIDAIVDIHENQIICIVGNKDFDYKKNRLLAIRDEVSEYTDVRLVMGDTYKDLYGAKKSYEECIKVNKLYESNEWNNKYIDYREIGFYKVVFEVEDIEKLKKYCYEVLGKIIECDKNSDLLKTLRLYLNNNCNLINTSKEMFIHRNTLIYRLNKIKDILGNNLEDQILKNELMNAIMIYDYLNSLE